PNRLSPSIAARPRSWRPIWRRPRPPDFGYRPEDEAATVAVRSVRRIPGGESRAEGLTDAGLRTPRAAAIAGVAFFAADPDELRIAAERDSHRSAGVGRAARRRHHGGRPGAQRHSLRRDRRSVVHRRHSRPARSAGGPLFCDRVLGSGLLFLGMLFVAAAIIGAMLTLRLSVRWASTHSE